MEVPLEMMVEEVQPATTAHKDALVQQGQLVDKVPTAKLVDEDQLDLTDSKAIVVMLELRVMLARGVDKDLPVLRVDLDLMDPLDLLEVLEKPEDRAKEAKTGKTADKDLMVSSFK